MMKTSHLKTYKNDKIFLNHRLDFKDSNPNSW